MHPTPELVALIQRDRERDVERRRLARLVECVQACCSPSLFARLTRAVRAQPASC